MGRRNITTAAKIQLSMKKVDIFRARAKKRQLQNLKNQQPVVSLDPGEGSGKVSEEIANDAGCSGKTSALRKVDRSEIRAKQIEIEKMKQELKPPKQQGWVTTLTPSANL